MYRIYADDGISGTAADNRDEFCQMIKDGTDRCFDLIITKEVSRFSRNILDTIYYTRLLRNKGINVIFVNDGINTADADAELRLSIMASLAQEESRRTSARVKWGQQRRMEQGVVFGRSLLGYDVQNGEIYVNPEGAKIVEQIYKLYTEEKLSSSVISIRMQEAGCNLPPSRIIKILRNEKYCGDLVQKKTYTPDYLSHKKKYNHGQEAFVSIKDHHKAIISRDLWNKTQREISLRARRHASTDRFKAWDRMNLCCGMCSANLLKRSRQLKNGTVTYWFCACKTCSLKRSIRSEQILNMISMAIESLEIEFKKQADENDMIQLVDKILLLPDTAVLTLKHLPQKWIFSI